MRSAPSVPWIRRRMIRRISWCGIGIDSRYTGRRVGSSQVIAIGAIVVALSMVLVLSAEIGRRWADRRLASA